MMRGANCWTDHKPVRAKLRVTFLRSAKRKEISLPFAIHKLKFLPRGMNTVKYWSSICWLYFLELKIPLGATGML